MGILKKSMSAVETALDRYIGGGKKSSQKLIKSVPLGIDDYHRKTIWWDENQLVTDTGFKEKFTGITFETLQRMAMRDSIVALVINKIINNVTVYSKPSPSKFESGFKVVLKNAEEEQSTEDKKICHHLEQWILTCGNPHGRPREEEMDFETFMRVETRDSLIFGQTAIELIRDRLGRIHHFWPAPAVSIRYVSPNFKLHPDMVVGPVYGPDGQKINNDQFKQDWSFEPATVAWAKYCQIHQQRIIQLFSEDELIVTQSSPINDIESRGYSLSILELLVNTVSSHIFTETHNRLFFTNGMSQNGVLFIKGDIPYQEMESFRRAWHAVTAGARNAARLPIISGVDDMQWINMSVSNKDMEWQNWNNYLIKLICASFLMNPTEINFDIVQEKGSGGFSKSQEGKIETQNRLSKVESLRPLLRYFERIINNKIIPQAFPDNNGYISKKYKFQFVGLDYDKDKELERIEKETQTYKTLNEARKELGHPPLNVPGADEFIRDPTYFAMWSQFSQIARDITKETMLQNQQMEAPMEGGGAPVVNTEIKDVAPIGDKDMKEDVVPLGKSKQFKPLLTVQYFK